MSRRALPYLGEEDIGSNYNVLKLIISLQVYRVMRRTQNAMQEGLQKQ